MKEGCQDLDSSVVGIISTIVGGAIGFGSAWLVSGRTIDAQKILQQRAFERSDQAIIAIIRGLLRDVYQYVAATARNAQFDQDKWARPVSRLLDYVTKIEVGQALTADQLSAVIHAAFEADLALKRLTDEIRNKSLPFASEFPELHPDVDLDRAEELYVLRMRVLARDAFRAFNSALELMGMAALVVQGPAPSTEDIRNDFRAQIGRPPVKQKV